MTASSASPITIINSFITQPHTASAAISAKPQPLEKFYKGEPLALGVKGSLGMNIISSVLAGCAMILYLISLMESRYQSRCDWYPENCFPYSVVIYQNMVPPGDSTTATNTHTDAVACTPPPYKDLTTA
ncbi:hypothetical protein UY3_00608 [Chelonia mydas]|uniref:Membrane-spanning 4-domains subfamily A member 15 n=1 Tax=Chelonia mydas TaxID=8469 RepID=M7CLR6_CHEMY|nr:hypothetical protein UY3_00608 [Chelonia mydas]